MAEDFLTQPALRTLGDSPGRCSPTLRLTLVFHPDLERIGQWVDLCIWDPERPDLLPREICLGRYTPVFTDGRPIEEPHTSRLALKAAPVRPRQPGAAAGLRIEADDHADVRIGPSGHRTFIADPDALQRGVPIRLAHAVVLVLRWIPEHEAEEYEPTRQLLSLLPGSSPQMMKLRRDIAHVAPTPLSVLILGESGVGKEWLARAVHAFSGRAEQPMVAVNLAAVPADLAAAELFGSVRGAFTGARDRPGAFQRAHGGTLFLDEIADAPVAVQVQLLRALEQGEIQVLGGDTACVDVRVIAATDQSVDKERGFRAALRHRLAGYILHLPPLRDRPEDIAPQAIAMLDDQVPVRGIVDPLLAREQPPVAAHWARFFFDALSWNWPGNSRDLRHAVTLLAAGHEPPQALTPGGSAQSPVTRDPRISEEHLERVYEAHDYEVSATAAALGLSRQALYRRLQLNPRCALAEDLTDAEVAQALEQTGSLQNAARALRVSQHALRPRLRRLGVL